MVAAEHAFTWSPAPVELHIVPFVRATPGCISRTKGEGAWFYEEVPLVTGGCSPELQDALNRELFTFCKLDPDNPRRSLVEQADSWQREWREDRAAYPNSASTMHSWSHTTAKALYNADGLLTVEVAWVGNGGHQNWYDTRVATWDVTSGRRVDAKGLVATERQAQLACTAARLLREDRADLYWDPDELRRAFLETENVAVVADGLLYSFDPFEIAGRPQGVIRHIVPWAEVRALCE